MFKVKINSIQKVLWKRQLPAWGNQWENCEFLFNEDAENYDYLVVFDEPSCPNLSYTCPRENTILIITEPISVKIYPPSYTSQFSMIISHQEKFAIKHPNVIYTQTGFPWSYGIKHGSQNNLHQWASTGMGFDEMAALSLPEKNKVISTVCSGKGKETALKRSKKTYIFHGHRFAFTQALSRDLPALDFYGRNHYPIEDKADAIKHYKYHLAIENYSCDNWWTEKFADAYLGYALPIIYGCPNLHDFFPEDSYIRINIYNYSEALNTIKNAIKNNEYEKRLPAIQEARRRLLYEHNIFALIHRTINGHTPKNNSTAGGVISGRLACRTLKQMLKITPYIQYKLLKYKSKQYVKKFKNIDIHCD